MATLKYKNAFVILNTGEEIPVKSPSGRLSGEYFTKHAYHYANVRPEQVSEIKLIS